MLGEEETVTKSLSHTEGPRGSHLCLLVNIRRFQGPFGAQVGTIQLCKARGLLQMWGPGGSLEPR